MYIAVSLSFLPLPEKSIKLYDVFHHYYIINGISGMKDEEKTKNQLIEEISSLRLKVSELKMSEERHRDAAQQLLLTLKKLKNLETIINKSPVMAVLWPLREGWPVEFVSSNVEQILGYTADEFVSGRISWPP